MTASYGAAADLGIVSSVMQYFWSTVLVIGKERGHQQKFFDLMLSHRAETLQTVSKRLRIKQFVLVVGTENKSNIWYSKN